MQKITILQTRSKDSIAAKTFEKLPNGLLKVTEYRAGKGFAWMEIEIDSIAMLADLNQILEESKYRFIVQAELIPAFRNREIITRTLSTDPTKRQVAMLRAIRTGVYWAMFDFDSIPLPPGMTPQEGIELLIRRLPPEFRDASYCYQLSSSAGLSGTTIPDPEGESKTYHGWNTLSVHVFFWFTRPVQNIAQWAKNMNATVIAAGQNRIVDPSTLETVQPNYTAVPTFENLDDPVAAAGYARSGFVRKASDAVDLVWIDKPITYVTIDDKAYPVGAILQLDGSELTATPSLADRIAAIGVGNDFRAPLMRAMGYYYWYHGTAASEDEIKGLLRSAFPGGVKDYLSEGKLSSMVRCEVDPIGWTGIGLSEERLSAISRSPARRGVTETILTLIFESLKAFSCCCWACGYVVNVLTLSTYPWVTPVKTSRGVRYPCV